LEAVFDNALRLSIFWGPKLLAAGLIIAGASVLARFVNHAIEAISGRTQMNALIASLMARAVRITLLVVGIITAMGTLGVNISALVAGLGLTGFALGFALRDTISNVLAGVLLLIYRPFDINDLVSVTGQQGLVVDIDLRYTTLENDAHRVLIPNSVLFTNPIIVTKRQIPARGGVELR
jgi:small conductance mechanosensitive channel